ncbi:MAG: hypothetical protein HY094_08040 [Candidatus Melainabacteria bacterium]|nr:hypothetical protein [Candidatus Melainabacteria bacterium]
MKNLEKIICVVVFLLFIPNIAFAGFFTMNAVPPAGHNTGGQSAQIEEIPVQDSQDRLIQKRREEAHKLVAEGKELIKKGEKRKNQSLIIKGKIKKEIGEKQLKLLKEQVENKKKEDSHDGW